jgi:hypothetical protein
LLLFPHYLENYNVTERNVYIRPIPVFFIGECRTIFSGVTPYLSRMRCKVEKVPVWRRLARDNIFLKLDEIQVSIF